MTSTFQPTRDRILVRPHQPKETVTPGGIVLPQKARNAEDGSWKGVPAQGTVLAVGPGTHHQLTGTLTPCCVAPGAVIEFGAAPWQHFTLDGESLALIQDSDVRGVYHGE